MVPGAMLTGRNLLLHLVTCYVSTLSGHAAHRMFRRQKLAPATCHVLSVYPDVATPETYLIHLVTCYVSTLSGHAAPSMF